ncbi:conserved Plasmodium protein, unknown function [Plasmodium ovale wallikeri]|uniref:Uncharacterized protein n=1 Tax=Plasmodium ovale wallikeri TaxID=864142 RepID=A0A1A8YJ27_PLAOA|nr:conserved Plasmodium protein, unknown function [Plasmodium ovale wallikeri]
MNLQKAIAKWVERKRSLERAKRGRRFFFFFKTNVKKSLFTNALWRIVKKGNVLGSQYGYPCYDHLQNGEGSFNTTCNGGMFVTKKRILCEQVGTVYNHRRRSTNILKHIMLNLKNIHHLVGTNDTIYVQLSHLFADNLQYIHSVHFNSDQLNNVHISSQDIFEKSSHNISGNDLSLEDLIHLFDFYISIKIYHVNFFNIILRAIDRCKDIRTVNDDMVVGFLKSCVKVKKEMWQNCKLVKPTCLIKKKGFTKRIEKISTNRSPVNYFSQMQNSILTKNGTLSIHALSPTMRRRHLPPRDLSPCTFSTPPLLTREMTNEHNLRIFRQKRHFHFFLLQKKQYKRLMYCKFRRRKYRDSMKVLENLVQICATTFLSRPIDKEVIANYVKVIRRGNILDENSSRSFNDQVVKHIKMDCSYFPPDELLLMVKYLTKMKVTSKDLNKSLTRISSTFYETVRKGNWHHYSIKEISDIICTFSKLNYNDDKFVTSVTRYIIENLNAISSKVLTRTVITLFGKLNCKRDELLHVIMNMYESPSQGKRRTINTNSLFLKENKLKYRNGIGSRCREEKIRKVERRNYGNHFSKNDEDCTPNRNNINQPTYEKYVRSYYSVKIYSLLLYIKILVDNNIYIDEKWLHYFTSLIKNKFLFMKKKNYHLLCHILLHIESKEIFLTFFLPCSKYNIHTNISQRQVVTSCDLPSLVQISLLFSFHIYEHTADVFLSLMLKVMCSFCHSCGIPYGEKRKGGVIFAKREKGPFPIQLPDKEHFIEQTNLQNVFVHELKIYERGKNNKYRKKREQKKRHHFVSKIGKIKFPICDQVKKDIFLQNLTQYGRKTVQFSSPNGNVKCDPWIEKTDMYESTHFGTITQKVHATLRSGKSQFKNGNPHFVSDWCENGIAGRTNITPYNDIEGISTNTCRVPMPHYFYTHFSLEKGKHTKEQGNISSKSNNKKISLHMVDKKKKKMEDRSSTYFDRLGNARNILLIIYNFIFHLKCVHNVRCAKEETNHISVETMLSELLTYMQLQLLFETYSLCCSHIDTSIKTEKIMNNNKNALSSKFHKEVLSLIRQMVSNERGEMHTHRDPVRVYPDSCAATARRPCCFPSFSTFLFHIKRQLTPVRMQVHTYGNFSVYERVCRHFDPLEG